MEEFGGKSSKRHIVHNNFPQTEMDHPWYNAGMMRRRGDSFNRYPKY